MFQDNHTRCKAKQSIIMIITPVSFPSFFYGVRIAYSFRFLCCFVLFVFVLCLVPNVACVSGLSIIDCPFGFLEPLFPHVATSQYHIFIYMI